MREVAMARKNAQRQDGGERGPLFSLSLSLLEMWEDAKKKKEITTLDFLFSFLFLLSYSACFGRVSCVTSDCCCSCC